MISWYSYPSANYVILSINDNTSSSNEKNTNNNNNNISRDNNLFSSINHIKPCDIRNQLLGTKISSKPYHNEVKYMIPSKVINFQVLKISTSSSSSFQKNENRENSEVITTKEKSTEAISKMDDAYEAVITRTTQIFIAQSDQLNADMIFSFSHNTNDWMMSNAYSREHVEVALSIHDPTLVSTLLGTSILFLSISVVVIC